MNKLEKMIYDKVKRNPHLKDIIRNIYQGILSLVPKPRIETSYECFVRDGYFFGFHDKTPWSYDDSKLLSHKYIIGDRKLNKSDEVEIGYFHGLNYSVFEPLAKTKSWNWQQGSMLQWVGKSNNILFNYWNGKNNVSKIININGETIKVLPKAVGALNPQGTYALSYSFERLNIGMNGYGYLNENDVSKYESIPQSTGLTLINIETKKETFLFSVKDIVQNNFKENMRNSYHFFTHALFSPNGKRFLFLHRWYKAGERLYTRMISSDLNGENKYIFPTDGMVSHVSWLDDNEIIAYCNTKKFGDAYHVFNDCRDKFYAVDKTIFDTDGHPQYNIQKDLIVTDTYPNKYRQQSLYLFDYKSNKKTLIAKLRSPLKFKGIVRCDLHPRWNRNGDMICVDSAHTGQRALCTIKLE